MRKRDNIPRLIAIAALYVVVALVYVGRLLYLQVSGQDYYSMSTPAVTYTRTVAIQAQRGEIYDRNGVPLVQNHYRYTVSLDYETKPGSQQEVNEFLLEMEKIAARTGEQDRLTQPKDSFDVTILPGGLSFAEPEGFYETARGRRCAKFIDELNVEEDASADEKGRAILLYFGILSKERNSDTGEDEVFYTYTYETAAKLFRIRMDMILSGFSAVQPYPLAADVSLPFLTAVEESFSRGLSITVDAQREYNYPGFASHILGYVGKIPDSQMDYYTEKGYAYNAVVGRSGAEAAFEDYLHGTDGSMTITEDSYGNVVGTEIIAEPIAGKDVYLTLDVNMQIVAEKALAENIFKIRAEANPYKPLTGEDASAGAITVLDVKTSDVLAIASYPTYNLATFQEDIGYLLEDPLSPMLNRALSSGYAPGSTFKPGVAVAALSEGTITKDTVIEDQGKYMYYADSGYTPRCWLYLLTGENHGFINVVEAIQESCNCFFYDVGRRLTIEKMNEYCKLYGLGEHTGIELPEYTGILAGPEYRDRRDMGQWSPGDTLQAAIGQSDNLFTPLQISCYISTLLGSGTRHAAHILREVREYGSAEPVYQSGVDTLSEFTISPENLATVKAGMKGVMDNGSAASVFADYPIAVGGKTGTAQVHSDKSDNAVMTAFAPFDDPEIVVTCVIEQGSGGTEAGYSVRDIFDYYFGVDYEAMMREKAEKEAAEEAAYYAALYGYDEEDYDNYDYDYDEYEDYSYEDYDEYDESYGSGSDDWGEW